MGSFFHLVIETLEHAVGRAAEGHTKILEGQDLLQSYRICLRSCEGNISCGSLVVHDLRLFRREIQSVVGEKGPGDAHEGIESCFRPPKENEVISKKYCRYVSGVKIKSQPRGVQLLPKIIYEQTEQERREIAA